MQLAVMYDIRMPIHCKDPAHDLSVKLSPAMPLQLPWLKNPVADTIMLSVSHDRPSVSLGPRPPLNTARGKGGLHGEYSTTFL